MSKDGFCFRATLLAAYRTLTCNALPVPSRLKGSSPATWPEMEAALRRTGQAHVLSPPPPEEKRDAFLEQLRSVDLDGLSSMLEISLAGAEARTVTREPFPDVVSLDSLPALETINLRDCEGLTLLPDASSLTSLSIENIPEHLFEWKKIITCHVIYV